MRIHQQDDITHGLPTLQFDANLSDSESSLLHLRKQTFELLLHAASQSTFLVGMLNTFNHYLASGELPKPGTLPKNRVSIGIIGGGRLCKHIVRALLYHTACLPHDITISTFQPELLEREFAGKGVRVCCDNGAVMGQSDLVLVCVPAAQLVVLQREVGSY